MARGRITLTAVVGIGIAGCGGTLAPPPPTPTPVAGPGDDHAHKPGAHGGTLIALGRDSCHAEAVFEKGGTVRLYTLGKDEARVQEVEARELTAYLFAGGTAEAETMTFRPDPQTGDAAGETSRFTATLPKDLIGKAVQVTVTDVSVNGERFRIAFSNAAARGEMPAKLGAAEERALSLAPGGKYTAADVAANGNAIPTEKHKGVRARHDDSPKPGDRICPISKTKANPAFARVVGGKSYEFCCVPCVEEFVTLAKERPAR